MVVSSSSYKPPRRRDPAPGTTAAAEQPKVTEQESQPKFKGENESET